MHVLLPHGSDSHLYVSCMHFEAFVQAPLGMFPLGLSEVQLEDVSVFQFLRPNLTISFKGAH